MNAPSLAGHAARLPALIEAVESRLPAFAKILPPTISAHRFVAAIKTALLTVPGLAECDRQSIVLACMRCASDGLVPDGRDAVLVVGTTKKDGQWTKAAQYWPMSQGLQKIAYRSGAVTRLEPRVVYANDDFELTFGSSPQVRHKPVFGEARGDIIGAYCVASLKGGAQFVEWMELDEITAIMRRSKSANRETGEPKGPWLTDFAEMCRKTVLRRALKYVPNEIVAAHGDEPEIAPEAYTVGIGRPERADSPIEDDQGGLPDPIAMAEAEMLRSDEIGEPVGSDDWTAVLETLRATLASCPGKAAVEETWQDWDASFDNVPTAITARAKEMVDARLYEMAKG